LPSSGATLPGAQHAACGRPPGEAEPDGRTAGLRPARSSGKLRPLPAVWPAWRARSPGRPAANQTGARGRTHRFAGAGTSAGLQPLRPPGVPAVAWRIRGRVIVHAPAGTCRARAPIPVEVEPLGEDGCAFEPARTVRRCSPS